MTPYGTVGRFPSGPALVQAVDRLRNDGYSRLEAYTSYPVDGLDEALGFRRSLLPAAALTLGFLGAAGIFAMMTWASVVNTPLDVGGRPLFSWPSFLPITFELFVLSASGAAFLGFFLLCRLPKLHHPIFSTPGFDMAGADRFFLCVRSEDPRYEAARDALVAAGAESVEETPA